MFASAGIAFSLWLVDIFLFLGGVYLVWRTYKTYRHKGRQKEEAVLVSKELAPYFDILQTQIQDLKDEIHELKQQNEKTDSADSLDSRC